MARTKLRAFEWAGLQVAIEEPVGFGWDWPSSFADRSCHPDAPDVYVSVHPLREQHVLGNGIPYCHEGSLFEAGRLADDHLLQVAGDRRAARFDRDFRWCDVWLPPSAIRSRLFPLARPLDDLAVTHRALVQGGLVVRATAAVRQGRALVVLGDSCLADPKPGTSVWEGWLLLEPGCDATRVFPLPSTRTTGPDAARGAVLEGLHAIDSVSQGDGVQGTLDPEIAAGEILRFAFAPLAGSESGDRLLRAATRLAEAVSLVRLGAGVGPRFSWKRARSPLSLAPPAGA